ncbi:MAG: hypothetical protein JNM65_01580 [Verrucomicrobiaceae bacterium]|nr:hypothetical protein [Verrucomicrobiaceae bacterium]
MSVLLVSLGTSPAIVPEAFLLPGSAFTDVHVLTTDSTKVDFVIERFRDHAPQVTLTITRVAGFTDFKSEKEHFQFEEVLYRWWLGKCPEDAPPHVCLSGGFKTMSAAMQKAAAVLQPPQGKVAANLQQQAKRLGIKVITSDTIHQPGIFAR